MGNMLGARLRALREGRTTFQAFVESTKDDWRKMAAKLYRRWPLPSGVTEDDVEQEMLLAAWVAVGKWDERRGTPIETHVVWCAHAATKKWLHAQRNARGRRDGCEPSRHASSVSGMRVDSDGLLSHDELLDLFVRVEPRQEQAAEVRGLFEELPKRARSETNRRVIKAWLLNACDVDGAALDVYDDPDLRLELELSSPAEAQGAVRREVGSLWGCMAESRGGGS